MTDTTPDTAPCSKCGTEISTEIDRCPQCGYEPSNSTLAKLVFWLFALPAGALFGFIIVGSLLGAVVGGMTAGEAFGSMFAGALLGALPFWYIRRYRRQKHKKATE